MDLVVSLKKAKMYFSKYIELLESKEVDKIIIVENGNKVAQLTLINNSDKIRVGAGHKYAPTMEFDLKNDIFAVDDLFYYQDKRQN